MPEQTTENTETVAETTEKVDNPTEKHVPKRSKLKRFFAAYRRKKMWTLPVTFLVILIALLLVPITRFVLVGWFWQEKITVTVYDTQNHSRVTQATVKIDSITVQTDSNGQAKVEAVHVGNRSLSIEKKYYKTANTDVTVDVLANGKNYDASLQATGRLNKVTVTNRITGSAVEGALIDAGEGNQAKTDKAGVANVIIPADKQNLIVVIAADGYNKISATIQQGKANTQQLVPSGKMYFLSKASGKVDVVKTNYDGTDRQVVVAGTGQEDDGDTSLLASRDWKYLLLKTKREASKPASLYLISTSDGSMTVMDQGDASFIPIGWSGHRFVYKVDRNNIQAWQPKKEALKSINAENKQLSTLDETNGIGAQGAGARESLANFYILDNQITYTKVWSNFNAYYYSSPVSLADKQTAIISIAPDGTSKKTLKSFSADQISYITARLYEPQEVYYQINPTSGDAQYFKLEGGAIKTAASDESTFNKPYPTYLVSPDGSKTFWSEPRDGKNALFIGGKNAEDAKQITAKSDFTPYGWMTDDYLLMQKSNSELYITTNSQIEKGAEPLKISDYHKPNVNYAGYGYGYGGQ
jgi:hypothetical protein